MVEIVVGAGAAVTMTTDFSMIEGEVGADVAFSMIT